MSSLSIYPLGDAALTAELGGASDETLNDRALAIREHILNLQSPFLPGSPAPLEYGITDIIVAWHTVTVFFDPIAVRLARPDSSPYDIIRKILEQTHASVAALPPGPMRRSIRIPVCFGGAHGPDLEWLAGQKGIEPEEAIHIHTDNIYRVYMVGFLPGFPYLGTVDPRLHVPRKDRPVPVRAGSVGIAGRQTGIYPFDSPGGWRIIGRTPWSLFDPNGDPPTRLQTGDRVQFFPIPPEEFGDYLIKS